jgi:predicted nucleic acid-binding protein
MKILLDTNVVLDHFLEKKPFADAASFIFAETERGNIESYVGATTVTTIHYLVTKAFGKKSGKHVIESLLRLFEVAPVTRTTLSSALLLKFEDFEDAVLHEAAIHLGLEAIITRDPKGFKNSKISVYSSDEFILAYSSLNTP